MFQRLVVSSPISVFYFHGAPCCPSMEFHKSLHFFLESPHVFLAPKIEEANVCLVLGNISTPLSELIKKSLIRMPKKRVMVHFLGCDKAAHNFLSLDIKEFPTTPSLTFSSCTIDERARKSCIEGIYTCLKA